ncbi:SDR family oxidoreductase [Arthrobacter sp. BL-252-APC-1A]|uniref:SDR family oxidoreductase n=1 Tax=Arthrobacter sp. BL-252-APC-1A TaxID=2606622 RepID=UPI0012B25926|nr:SDR family oxidoreductase [Arthrobacter sp. BL-252-APC-1A]MSR97494.1 SDR family oxidoreductase [Arthrobacter sp. BL-252-APC-1A]
MARVAIIGGHGKVALQLAKDLAANGHEVSSLFRNPDHVEEVAATGAAPIVADLEKLDTPELAERLSGHDAVVWSAGAGGGSPERTYAVDRDAAIRSMEAAEQAGVRRYVMVSYMGAGKDHGVDPDNGFYAYAEAKAAADDHLRRSGLDWTILGPSALTDDPGTGRISVGGGQDGSVSRADVAAVAAEVLEQPGTVGQFIEFINGDTPIRDAVSAVTKA